MAIDRREFLRRSAIAGLGAGLLPLAAGAAEPAQVRRRVRLGRTGLQVPDIGFGSAGLRGGERLVLHALERGITYFDTAEGYAGGEAELTLGRALRGRRDEVVLVSKVKAGAEQGPDELMPRLEESLRRLRTDRVEIYLNHAVNHPARVRNDGWGEFVERAKQQGKIRYSGLSGHGGRLVECLEIGLERDILDVILVAYNFGQDPSFADRLKRNFDFVSPQPGLPRVLARAKELDVGVVAMKTLLGARLNDMRPYEGGGATTAQAAFRWVLSGPHVDALIVTMKSPGMVDEYLGASGWTQPHAHDARLLERYLALNGSSQCRYGCGECADACPVAVPISDVLRTRMYARDYGEPARAREEYAVLGQPASACMSCASRACADRCPHGLALDSLARDAHERLGRPGRL